MIWPIHIQQPTDNTCVQSCLAMYLAIPIAEVVAELPPRRSGTTHKRMIEYLKKKGIAVTSRMTSLRGKTLPDVALVRITWPNKKGHIVLKVGTVWYDPELPGPFVGMPPIDVRDWTKGGKMTSFLALPHEPHTQAQVPQGLPRQTG